MKERRYVLLSLLLISMLATSVTAYARSGYLTTFNGMYVTTATRLDDCIVCHINTETRNPYGLDMEAYLAMGYSDMNALSIIEPYDSDGDGYTNFDEIMAFTFPGDPSDAPLINCIAADVDRDRDMYSIINTGECGPVDCNDSDPLINPGAVEVCNDSVDNDCDALTDCDDAADCNADPACAVCTDTDNDTYSVEGGACGPVDCNDTDPLVNPGAAEVCDDTIDNDCDALFDCDDPDCDGDPACNVCIPTADNEKGPRCTDGLDNDCDGLTDCEDPDCSANKACK